MWILAALIVIILVLLMLNEAGKTLTRPEGPIVLVCVLIWVGYGFWPAMIAVVLMGIVFYCVQEANTDSKNHKE